MSCRRDLCFDVRRRDGGIPHPVADSTQALHAATKQFVDARLPAIAKGDLITHTGTVLLGCLPVVQDAN